MCIYTYRIAKNFCWTKISPSPATFVLQKYKFLPICGEGHHILYVIINTGQKNSQIKILPTRIGGKIGENNHFHLAKISGYTVSPRLELDLFCASYIIYNQGLIQCYLFCYSGGVFQIKLTFDENFNSRPPEVHFMTMPFHPNGEET